MVSRCSVSSSRRESQPFAGFVTLLLVVDVVFGTVQGGRLCCRLPEVVVSLGAQGEPAQDGLCISTMLLAISLLYVSPWLADEVLVCASRGWNAAQVAGRSRANPFRQPSHAERILKHKAEKTTPRSYHSTLARPTVLIICGRQVSS